MRHPSSLRAGPTMNVSTSFVICPSRLLKLTKAAAYLDPGPSKGYAYADGTAADTGDVLTQLLNEDAADEARRRKRKRTASENLDDDGRESKAKAMRLSQLSDGYSSTATAVEVATPEPVFPDSVLPDIVPSFLPSEPMLPEPVSSKDMPVIIVSVGTVYMSCLRTHRFASPGSRRPLPQLHTQATVGGAVGNRPVLQCRIRHTQLGGRTAHRAEEARYKQRSCTGRYPFRGGLEGGVCREWRSKIVLQCLRA